MVVAPMWPRVVNNLQDARIMWWIWVGGLVTHVHKQPRTWPTYDSPWKPALYPVEPNYHNYHAGKVGTAIELKVLGKLRLPTIATGILWV